jgi:3D (Asp-Asp-Asp) domain-containing protein
LVALFFSSCASDSGLSVVSKSRANSAASGNYPGYFNRAEVYTTAQPSPQLFQHASGKPKDKHGMAFYKPSERTRLVRTTAYTCSEDDHIEYGSMNAAGTPLRYTNRVRSAAADWAVYPVGTVFRIKGMPHLFVVDDYGSALTGTNTVDIYTPSKDHMKTWGRRNVELTVVQWGSYSRSAEILAKRTHHPHCAQMYTAINRMMSRATASTAAR